MSQWCKKYCIVLISINLNNCLSVNIITVTKGDCFKLKKYYTRLNIKRGFLAFKCVIDLWNYLPHNVVSRDSIRLLLKNLTVSD